MRNTHKLLAVAALMIGAASANATSLEWVNVTGASPPEPNTFQTWDLNLTLTGSDDFLSARLHAAGTFYQDAFGSDNAPPNPALVSVFPSLAFDTFVASPAGSATVLGKFDGSNSNPNTDTGEGPPPATFSASELAIVWGDTVTSSPGTYPIAQITFSGAVPSIVGRASFGSSANIQNAALPQIPEPISLGLVAIGATTMLRKPRK